MTNRAIRSVFALLLGSLLLAACGTRLPESDFAQVQTQGVTNNSDSSNNDNSSGDDLTTDGSDSSSGDNAATDDGSDSGSDPSSGGSGNSSNGGGNGAATADGPNTASDVGVTATSITIGTIVAENGVLGDAFAPSARGMRAWAAAINAAGGFHGRQVVLKTCDDREDRNRDLQCAQQLIEKDKVFALIATNSRAFGGSAQYLADRGIPVIGEPITASFYRYPTMFSVYQNGYKRDGKTVGYNGNLVSTSGIYRWFKQNLNITKAAVFAYDVDESKQAGDFMKKGLELEGFSVTQYVVSFAAPSFDQAVADMQRQGTQIILDAMDDGANRKLCDAMERRKFSVKAKVSTIVSMGDTVGNNYNDTCRNSVFIPGQTLNYQATSVPEIAKFRQAYKRYQPGLPVHQWALEAWMMGNLFKSYANTSSPTRKGFVSYLNGLVQWKGDGIDVGLDWEKIDPAATKVKDCFTISRWLDSENGWTEATKGFPFCYPDANQYVTPASEQGN